MSYDAAEERYDSMKYNRCGNSGLLLPAISLGLWHNFGDVDDFQTCRQMILTAFDLGITHFDLANNYGPGPGSAEKNFGKILKSELGGYRDELIISTKAGYLMWPGPYGEWGSRKYLISSLDQSLKRLGVDYVDIFYSHRPDPKTPIEETMSALYHAVGQGKAIYAGISNYNPAQTAEAVAAIKQLGGRLLIHQSKYSMLYRPIEQGLLDVVETEGLGCIVFCPLAQGLLTDKYLDRIPPDSRAAKAHGFLKQSAITEELLKKIRLFNDLAVEREQSLAQMALAWVLREARVTSVLVGASRVEQIKQNVGALGNREFSADELAQIDNILNQRG